MQLMDGKQLAQEMRVNLKQKVQDWQAQGHAPPVLSVLQIGDNPVSKVYIRQKVKACEEVGIQSKTFFLPEDSSLAKVKSLIEELNNDSGVQALLVQLPLPKPFQWKEVISWIDPLKDPDCLTVENQGLACLGTPRVLPCTPAGIMKLLQHYDICLAGKQAVVVGRSHIVGLPMAHLLLQANATVNICHSHTKNLSDITRQADVVVVAAGRPALLTAQDFKKSAVVVDVGIHRTTDKGKIQLIGDVCFSQMQDKVGFMTPVPGGVGPMTVVMLLENTLSLARGYCGTQ